LDTITQHNIRAALCRIARWARDRHAVPPSFAPSRELTKRTMHMRRNEGAGRGSNEISIFEDIGMSDEHTENMLCPPGDSDHLR